MFCLFKNYDKIFQFFKFKFRMNLHEMNKNVYSKSIPVLISCNCYRNKY